MLVLAFLLLSAFPETLLKGLLSSVTSPPRRATSQPCRRFSFNAVVSIAAQSLRLQTTTRVAVQALLSFWIIVCFFVDDRPVDGASSSRKLSLRTSYLRDYVLSLGVTVPMWLFPVSLAKNLCVLVCTCRRSQKASLQRFKSLEHGAPKFLSVVFIVAEIHCDGLTSKSPWRSEVPSQAFRGPVATKTFRSSWSPLRTCLRELMRESGGAPLRLRVCKPPGVVTKTGCYWRFCSVDLERESFGISSCRRSVGFPINPQQKVSWFLQCRCVCSDPWHLVQMDAGRMSPYFSSERST